MSWPARVRIGLKGIMLRRVRSILSTLGVVFGVAAVIAMMSIGEGARREAVEQIRLLGTNTIRITRLPLTGERRAAAERQFSRGLTQEDAHVIRTALPTLLGVAPLKFVEAEVRLGRRQAIAQVVGTSPDYATVTSFQVVAGRFLTMADVDDAKTVCVLGSEVARELFPHGEAVDSAVRIGDLWFIVVGVMEPKVIRSGRAVPIKVRNLNRDVYIPAPTALRRFAALADRSSVEEIAVRVAQADALGPGVQAIRRLLRHRHRGVEDYEVVVPEALLAQAQQTQRIFNVVMGSIAGIALLVGGIGIMNIMLANVSERTREIGIRRAIGASRGDIMGQFLIETVLVCLAGGVLGILLGLGMAEVITLYAGWETGFSLASIFVAFLTAASVGLIFGLIPARRAAQLDPVQALRSE